MHEEASPKAKVLHGLGSGVMEITAYDESGAFRAVYSVSIGDAVYVSMPFRRSPRRELQYQRMK